MLLINSRRFRTASPSWGFFLKKPSYPSWCQIINELSIVFLHGCFMVASYILHELLFTPHGGKPAPVEASVSYVKNSSTIGKKL